MPSVPTPSRSTRARRPARAIPREPNARAAITHLEDLPNVGPSIAGDLRQIGISRPAQLVGRDPYALYEALCRRTGLRHDPCVIDTFLSAVRYMEGAPAKPWWSYTAERKATLERGSKRAAWRSSKRS